MKVGTLAVLLMVFFAGVVPSAPKLLEQDDSLGNGFHMKTSVKAQGDGTLVGTTEVRTANADKGFTGGVVILLVDKSGKVLYPDTGGIGDLVATKKVDIHQVKARREWAVPFPRELFPQIETIVIHHHRTSGEWLRQVDGIRRRSDNAADIVAKLKQLPVPSLHE